MKAMDLLTALGGVKDAYVIGAEDFRQGKCKVQGKHLSLKKAWLIAAVIAMMLLLVGCAVVYVLSLQDMKMDEVTITPEGWGPSGEYGPVTEWVSSRLSIQGYNDSPEQLALKEWLDFQEQYDQDNTLLKANNHNEAGVPEQYYQTYNCYTPEMMDRLNEILDKYSLKPLGAVLYFQRWEEPLFYKALQIDSLCQPDTKTGELAGYFFPEGSFHAEFDQALSDEATSRIVTFTYAKSQYLYPYYLAVRDLELWEQWHYAAADGTDVLLATHDNALLIICDCGDGFIQITTANPTPNTYQEQSPEIMTRQKAERIADSFHYSIHPKPCDPAQVEAMRSDYPEPERKEDPYVGFRMSQDGRWFPREEISDSFDHYFSFLLENDDNPENLEYCLTDLDSDGNEEIIIGWHDTGKIWQIVKMDKADESSEAEVSIRYVWGYLYEGPVLEYVQEHDYEDSMTHHTYSDYDGHLLEEFRHNSAKTWERLIKPTEVIPAEEVEWEMVSESVVRSFRNSLIPLSFDMKPLREFSMDE